MAHYVRIVQFEKEQGLKWKERQPIDVQVVGFILQGALSFPAFYSNDVVQDHSTTLKLIVISSNNQLFLIN